MKKRILSMILAMAMVVSLFAGIAVTASAAEGTYVLADAIAVGDTVVIGYAEKSVVLTDVAKISSNMCGISGDAAFSGNTVTTDAALVLTVEAGSAEGSVAFKTPAGQYLTWKSGNTLDVADEISDNASWNVTITEGVATIINVATAGLAAKEVRYLQFNASSPRFCAYKNSGKNPGFYKPASGETCLHEDATSEVTLAPKCTENGELTYTCSCGTTWTESIAATGHNYGEGEVITAADCTTPGEMSYACTAEGCEAAKTEVIPATGHNYVDGKCTICEEPQPEAKLYAPVTVETIVAGNYIVASNRKSTEEVPPVYPATSGISSGHWLVSDTAVPVVDGKISSADLPVDAVIFTLTGDKENGFTISYTTAEGEVMYLGYSSYAKAKNAFSADYSNFLWKFVAKSSGETALQTVGETPYTISTNSEAVTALRGYANSSIYQSVLLYKEVTGDEVVPCAHENTSEVEGIAPTCTTDGRNPGVVCDDCGAELSGFETIPAMHVFDCSVVDGNFYRDCINCDLTETHKISTIAEAKAYTDETVVYYVHGIVTYVSGRTVYIQDATGGLCVYFTYDTVTELSIGDEIVAWSTMTNFKGLLELNNVRNFVRFTCDNAVTATEATLAEIVADTTNEFLGERVTIKGLTVTEVDAKGAIVADAEGNSLKIYGASGIDAIVAQGDKINLTCIVSSYNGYQLIINPSTMVADIEIVPDFVEQEVKIGHSLNLASDISVNFAVAISSVSSDAECYMEVIRPVYEGNEQTGTRVVKILPTVNASYYYFTLTGVTAINMNDIVEARIYWTKDGVKYVSTPDFYSVGTYAYAQLEKTAATESLKKLCADLLVYGSKAQILKKYRTDALVDANMTDAMKAYLTDLSTVTFNENKGNQEDAENIGVNWMGMGIDLNSKVTARFVFVLTDESVNLDDLSVKITYTNYKGEVVTKTVDTVDVYNASRGYYCFTFDGLLAAELRTVMSAVIYNNETRVSSTYIYSIDTYGNGRTGDLLELCKALVAYSDTALAFFKK